MRRAAAGLLICLGIIACASGSEPTSPSPSETQGIAGTWTLRSIGKFNFSQQTLPFTDIDEVILAGVMKVVNDGTFSDELTLNSKTRKRSGTWTQGDSVLYRLRYPDMPAGEHVAAWVSGTNLLYHVIPETFVYTRDIPASAIQKQAVGQPFRGCTLVKEIARPSTTQGGLANSDCRLAESGFYAEWRVDYYEIRLTAPATFAIEEFSTDFDADWKVFDRATGFNLWSVSVKDVPERAWRRITLGAGVYVIAATSEFGKETGSYRLTIE